MRRLEKQWLSYECRVLPGNASATQRLENRRAFYAGAAAIIDSIMGSLTPGEEANPADLDMMEDLCNELLAFGEDVKAGRA